MTGDGGTVGPSFGELPDDLLGAIYRRCSSFYDQTRFAAVCTSWRAAVSWQPKLPALPLLLPSTGNGALDRTALAYSPEVGRVLRAPLPCFPYGKRIVGSYDGGWVAAAIGCRIEIVNLFTGDWLPSKGDITCRCPVVWRTDRRKISIEKVVFSEEPRTKGCILAATTTCCPIALCRFGVPDGGWITGGCATIKRFIDIAFCNGELYGLSRTEELYKVVVVRGNNSNKHSAPVEIFLQRLAIISGTNFIPKYIFELGGKLAMAVQLRGYKDRLLMVFEFVANIDTTESSEYTWTEVTSLGDHALFLGPGCCKAVQVSVAGLVEGNRIYCSKPQLPDSRDLEFLDSFDLGSCLVYSYENRKEHPLERIKSRGYHYFEKRDGISGRNSCTWILPTKF